MKIKLNKTTKMLLFTILAAFINAFAVKIFLKPMKIVPLGVPGAAVLAQTTIEHFFKITIQYYYLFFIMNALIGIWAYYAMGKETVLKTLVYIISFTIISRFIPVIKITNSKMLGTIVSGVCNATASSILLHVGSTMGGFTLTGVYLSKKLDKSIVGKFNLVINVIIIILFTAFSSVENALYSVLLSYLSARIIDKNHKQSNYVTLLIVTNNADNISEYVNVMIKRSATMLDSKGSYSRSDNNTLIVVTSKFHLKTHLQNLKQIDPSIYISVLETKKVIGNVKSDVGKSAL